MSTPPYLYRVRLHGGRHAHGARNILAGPDRVTACDYYLAAEAKNHWLPDGTAITCASCLRRMRSES